MADFLYFAYGSNMLTRRLTAPKRAPTAARLATAFAAGYRLTFDKVSSDGSGKCDIEETGNPDDRVYGVLFRVAFDEADRLDAAEGLGKGYRKGEIHVMTDDGMLPAVAYFATKKDAALLPYDWYKAYVVEGAIEQGLPADYIEALKAVPSKPDPDAARRTRREALLSS